MNPVYQVMILSCVSCCITMSIHLQNDVVLKKESRKWFDFTFWAIVLGACSELAGDWLNLTGNYPVVHLIIKAIEFITVPWIPAFMVFACGVDRHQNIIRKLLIGHTLLELVLLPFQKIIMIDEHGFYHRGSWYVIYMIASVIVLIFLLITLWNLSRDVNKNYRMTLILAVITLITGLVPSIVSSKIRTSFMSMTFTAVILYCYYESLSRYRLAKDVKDRNKQIRSMQTKTISGIAELIESRDYNTGNHIKNTSTYVESLARAAQKANLYPEILTEQFIETAVLAAPLHDVGKIVIPDAILLKPGKLTAEEFEVMKTHTTEGGNIVMKILEGITEKDYTEIAYDMATCHHERWDGNGYPKGLKGEEIPLCARIMAVADVYDALTMERVYKPAFSVEKALNIIEEETGTHFDPKLGRLFVKMIREQKDSDSNDITQSSEEG